MKKLLILTLVFIFIAPSLSEAQLKNILKRKSEKAVDKGIDEGIDSIFGEKKNEKDEKLKIQNQKQQNLKKNQPINLPPQPQRQRKK